MILITSSAQRFKDAASQGKHRLLYTRPIIKELSKFKHYGGVAVASGHPDSQESFKKSPF